MRRAQVQGPGRSSGSSPSRQPRAGRVHLHARQAGLGVYSHIVPSPTTAEDLGRADPSHLQRAARRRLRPDDDRHRRHGGRVPAQDSCRTSSRRGWHRACRLASCPAERPRRSRRCSPTCRPSSGTARGVRRLRPDEHAAAERGDRAVARTRRPHRLRRARRALATGRGGHAGGADPARVRPLARRLPGRVRRDHRHPRDVVRRRPLRRPDGRARRPAPGLRGPDAILLLHLREDYMEAAGDGRAIASLVSTRRPSSGRSSPAGPARRPPPQRPRPGGLGRRPARPRPRDGVGRAPRRQRARGGSVDAVRLFPAYLAAVEQLARRVDEW